MCPAESDTAKQTATTFQCLPPYPAGQIPFVTASNYSYSSDSMRLRLIRKCCSTAITTSEAAAVGVPTAGYTRTVIAFGTNTAAAPLSQAGWTDNQHQKQGNAGFADGSVQQLSTTRLRDALRNSGDNLHSNIGNGGPDGINRLMFP